MESPCSHLHTIRDVTPSAEGCEDCLRIGGTWVHLRLCLQCGHVGCCDQSPNRHATAHWREVAELPTTARGEGGFGSTGVQAPSDTARQKVPTAEG